MCSVTAQACLWEKNVFKSSPVKSLLWHVVSVVLLIFFLFSYTLLLYFPLIYVKWTSYSITYLAHWFITALLVFCVMLVEITEIPKTILPGVKQSSYRFRAWQPIVSSHPVRGVCIFTIRKFVFSLRGEEITEKHRKKKKKSKQTHKQRLNSPAQDVYSDVCVCVRAWLSTRTSFPPATDCHLSVITSIKPSCFFFFFM